MGETSGISGSNCIYRESLSECPIFNNLFFSKCSKKHFYDQYEIRYNSVLCYADNNILGKNTLCGGS